MQINLDLLFLMTFNHIKFTFSICHIDTINSIIFMGMKFPGQTTFSFALEIMDFKFLCTCM